MHKIKYLIKRIANLDYKNMYRIAGIISKKSGKSRISILIDMIICGFTYQAGYYDYLEFEFYNLNKSQRKTYLTRGKNNEIVRKYNNKEYFKYFDDKILFNKKFKNLLGRDYLYLDTFKEFSDFVKNKKSIIVKPIDGEGGKGVEKINITSNIDLKDLFNKLKHNKQLLIEDVIMQHKDMNKIYDKSVNTIRMFTFYKNGEAHFLYGILKLGNGGVIDNFSNGGMYTFLNEDGKVIVPAIDRDDNIFYKHPITQEEIVGFQVPMYNDAIELVKKASKVIKEVGYVGWDVAISESGPVLVEGNCFPGVFQIKASLNPTKTGVIPKYSEFMDI